MNRRDLLRVLWASIISIVLPRKPGVPVIEEMGIRVKNDKVQFVRHYRLGWAISQELLEDCVIPPKELVKQQFLKTIEDTDKLL